VRVDGRPTELVTADHALLALRLPPGRHDVALRYRPATWDLGLRALVLGGVLAAASFLLPFARRLFMPPRERA